MSNANLAKMVNISTKMNLCLSAIRHSLLTVYQIARVSHKLQIWTLGPDNALVSLPLA